MTDQVLDKYLQVFAGGTNYHARDVELLHACVYFVCSDLEERVVLGSGDKDSGGQVHTSLVRNGRVFTSFPSIYSYFNTPCHMDSKTVLLQYYKYWNIM